MTCWGVSCEVERACARAKLIRARSIVEAKRRVDRRHECRDTPWLSRERDGAGVEIMSYAPCEPVTIETGGLRGRKADNSVKPLRAIRGLRIVFLCPEQVVLSSRSWRPTGENAKLINITAAAISSASRMRI